MANFLVPLTHSTTKMQQKDKIEVCLFFFRHMFGLYGIKLPAECTDSGRRSLKMSFTLLNILTQCITGRSSLQTPISASMASPLIFGKGVNNPRDT